jgi:hypothetical protein
MEKMERWKYRKMGGKSRKIDGDIRKKTGRWKYRKIDGKSRKIGGSLGECGDVRKMCGKFPEMVGNDWSDNMVHDKSSRRF